MLGTGFGDSCTSRSTRGDRVPWNPRVAISELRGAQWHPVWPPSEEQGETTVEFDSLTPPSLLPMHWALLLLAGFELCRQRGLLFLCLPCSALNPSFCPSQPEEGCRKPDPTLLLSPAMPLATGGVAQWANYGSESPPPLHSPGWQGSSMPAASVQGRDLFAAQNGE